MGVCFLICETSVPQPVRTHGPSQEDAERVGTEQHSSRLPRDGSKLCRTNQRGMELVTYECLPIQNLRRILGKIIFLYNKDLPQDQTELNPL